MKLKFIVCLFVLFSALSCKKEPSISPENAPVAKSNVTSIQLANYSDDNWKNGVGLTYNMVLVDYSKERLDLIAKGSELELPTGVKVKYIGYESKKNYIHIMLKEKNPSIYQAAIEYPNELKVK